MRIKCHERSEIRIKWWLDPKLHFYPELSILPIDQLHDIPVELASTNFYPETEKPVIFGHYWLKDEPNLYRNNTCCLDYSVAKGGLLAAYRFSGEEGSIWEYWGVFH